MSLTYTVPLLCVVCGRNTKLNMLGAAFMFSYRIHHIRVNVAFHLYHNIFSFKDNGKLISNIGSPVGFNFNIAGCGQIEVHMY